MNGAQVRMARAALKMNVRDLAIAAEVSPNTIVRIEADLPLQYINGGSDPPGT